jgi:hypothetical protein
MMVRAPKRPMLIKVIREEHATTFNQFDRQLGMPMRGQMRGCLLR